MRIAVFGTVVAALAVGHLTGRDAVSAVHGHGLGAPTPTDVAAPTLPQGVSQ
ncbi:MAG: hypothetical protein AAFU41_15945 [Pseudomonadota bacterium]